MSWPRALSFAAVLFSAVVSTGFGPAGADSLPHLRSIYVQNDTAAYYISFRCYTDADRHVDGWVVNQPWNSGSLCTGTGDLRPDYVRINRKDMVFRNYGSTWRVHFSSYCPDTAVRMCVYTLGNSPASGRYKVKCDC